MGKYYMDFIKSQLKEFTQRIDTKQLILSSGDTIDIVSFSNTFGDSKEFGGYMPVSMIKVAVNSADLIGWEENNFHELIGETATIGTSTYRINDIQSGDVLTTINLVDDDTK